MKYLITILTLIFILFYSGCLIPSKPTEISVNTNLCENINCPDKCIGNELWSQICVEGDCIDFKRIDQCAEYCGCKVDLCKAISCNNKCIGNDLWAYKCVNGICIQDKLIEECNKECGCKSELVIREIQPIETWIFNDPKDTSKIVTFGNVYLLYTKDKLGIILTCRKDKCNDYPAVYYGYKKQGEKDYQGYIQIEDISYWRPPYDAFYTLYFSPEYYIKIGYVD
ncbi:MAG: hypothetical protein APG10_01547 [Candidatus Methanofastidiosum methylothiophilum]|uniref:Uncharacterized protein n=1 Tax=Candidatus Methanofastidiosum methylothiophilum TaxID=1705564 RepID=A0A150II24_9EURY|nr:MAG: hypothetical protein APG10_01547 [Candidatus Methanofastidiosum methylthiophilus]